MALRLALAVFLVWGCAALGRRIVRSALTGLSHLAWDAPVGLAVLMAAMLAVGLLPGAYRPAPLLGFAGAVLAGSIVWDLAKRTPRSPATAGEIAALSIIVLVAALGLLWDRVPPVFFDTLSYHFAQPGLWLVQGRIAPVTWSLHSWFPPGMSVLFGAALAASGEAAANDVNLVLGLMLLAMAGDLARRLLHDEAASPIAVALLATLPIVIFAFGIPAADLGHGAFSFGALGSILLARDSADRSWLRRAGILAAGAVLTKYLGWIAPVGVGIVFLRSRRAGWLVVPPLIAVIPWLIADGRVTGNPVAPVLSTTIATRGLAPGGAEAFAVDAHGGLPGAGEVSAAARRLLTGDAGAARSYPNPAWGFTLAVAVPMGFWLRRNEPAMRSLVLLGVVLVALWLVTYRWERFLVAASGMFAIVAAGGIAAAWRRRGVAIALVPIVVLLAGLGAWRAALDLAAFTGGTPVALGAVSPDAFFARSLPFTEVYAAAGRLLDRSRDRVLVAGENRHFGLDVPHAAPTVFNLHPLAERLAAGDTPRAALAAMRRQGFSHLILDPARIRADAAHYPSLAAFREQDAWLDALIAALPAPLAANGSAALYEIPR